MKETTPKSVIQESEFVDIPNESPALENQEKKSLNSKGHERMAKIGNGLMRLFKGGKKLAIEGVATVLSIDDIAKRAAMKTKDAAVGVKDAVVKKTRESVTSARDGLVDAYHTTKEKGASIVNGGKEKVKNIKDAYMRVKLEIALASLKRKKEKSEEKTTKLQNQFAEKQALLAQFS